MAVEQFFDDKKAIIFGFDDVLYPEKDYLLQVYYLFAEFLAYSEQMDATKVLSFMRSEFEENGTTQIFQKTAKQFAIPEKYQENFDLLHQTARLPLKLLLFKNLLSLLQELVKMNKQIFLLIDGNPSIQLNKLRQMEWHGLEKDLKVYFTSEFLPKPATDSVDFILKAHHLSSQDVLLVGNQAVDENFAAKIGVEYLDIRKLL